VNILAKLPAILTQIHQFMCAWKWFCRCGLWSVDFVNLYQLMKLINRSKTVYLQVNKVTRFLLSPNSCGGIFRCGTM
jgi:hypothetical protein